jgi:2'-5' RNA ligase
LDAPVRDALAGQQALIVARLRSAGERSFRPVHSSQLHLTIAFLGEVAAERVNTVVEAMSADLAIRPFEVDFEGWGLFPPRGAPRVLWCGIGRGRDELVALYGEVTARLARTGIATDDRPFTPHLTMGRWRDRAAVRGNEYLPAPSRVATQAVQAVTLFESRLGPGGATHTPLADARLAGAAGPH